MKRIMCYGDSLTWGYRAHSDGAPPTRFAPGARWTGVLADRVRDFAVVVEEGLSGRTTDLEDPEAPYRNGAAFLPVALRTHTPIDLVVLMLGTNDTKAVFRRSGLDIAVSLAGMVRTIQSFTGPDAAGAAPPQVLLVCPPPICPDADGWIDRIFAGANDRIGALSAALAAFAEGRGIDLVDAGQLLVTGGVDGVHFDEANNRVLGEAVAEEATRLLT
ncbi:GDSL-type esterase/lipase family protein [Tropicimonas sp. IMCC34043]|uniref:GDSL-type esterase/lipase family protein n=1 Tax=Tropicimonas sp. IMCC34043 TaxID=2248760 RepID=UPI000E260C75|nr:GDSL-type esterase/lipase family protein [Tropicimonas sp. IMCC34043]